MRGLSLVVASGAYSSLKCTGFSLQWLLLLHSSGSRCTGFSGCGARAPVVVARGLWSAGSVVVGHGLSCSTACGIFPDQESNSCPLHWQADSYPLCHQGSPYFLIKKNFWPHCAACRTLFPQPGIESVPLAVEVQSLHHWTAKEVLTLKVFNHRHSNKCTLWFFF